MATPIFSENGTSSDGQDTILICSPCKDDGSQRSAEGYCVNCREYLCQRCFETHLIPSITRKHVLLDKEHMMERGQYESEHMCSEHKGEEVKYHCATHAFIGCHTCFFIHQKTCKDVTYIPDISNTVASSEEFNAFNRKFTVITKQCREFVASVEREKERVKASIDEATTAIKQFKREVLELIDQLENELIVKTFKIKETENAKLNQLSTKCQTILIETQKMNSKIESLLNNEQHCGLYIALQQSKDQLLHLEDDSQCLTTSMQNKSITFESNNELLKSLQRPWGLGNLQITWGIETIKLVKDINIKTAEDRNTSSCWGSVTLPNDRLFISDYNNNVVKLIDTRQNKLIAYLKLPSQPWGVCNISGTTVAVILPDKMKIVFVKSGPPLSIEREIGVRGHPRGIGHYGGQLVVSYAGSNKIEIMDLQGTVISTYDKDSNGHALFKNPWYLTIHPSNKLIYVSNYSSHNVVCMKFDGTFVASYKDKDLNGPRQIATDSDGNIYVCGQNSNNVHQITENCKKVRVILTRADGLEKPWSLSYDETEGNIYVGQCNNECIKTFHIEFSKKHNKLS